MTAVMLATPTPTAGAFLVDNQGRVLLGLRAAWKANWPNRWDAVGGGAERGETAEQALARELQEEIGVTPTAFRLLEVIPEHRPDGDFLHHLYAVTAWNGEPANICDEHTEIAWFDRAAALALPNLADPSYPRLIALALEAARA
jgi:8-oxo-dGTP diphosphatase